MSHEVIQLHVGQAGCQIANACWELYCLEHGINANGCLSCASNDFNTFFSCGKSGKVIPRLIMVDSEPTVIDEIRTGGLRNLFHPGTLISGKEDCGNNFARGYFLLSREMLEPVMNAIRLLAEASSNLQGFLMFRSFGGGTGSGFGTRILEELASEYEKISRIEFALAPSPLLSSAIVEPYNSVLANHISLECCGCSCLMGNEALYDICCDKLNVHSPTFKNINRIIGQVVSCITASLRFEGPLSANFRDFETNLVPFPRAHFPIMSYAPFIPYEVRDHEPLETYQLTNALFTADHHIIKCDPLSGRFISCVVLYRGKISPSDVNNSIRDIKNKYCHNFLNWSPTGVKIGITYMPPTCVPCSDQLESEKAACMLSNNTNVRNTWCEMLKKYMILLEKKAYLYHYVNEGLSESDFTNAQENICSLVDEYDSLGTDDDMCNSNSSFDSSKREHPKRKSDKQ